MSKAKILELRENRDKASSRIFHLSDAVSQLTSESSVHSIEKTRKDSNLDLIAAKIVAYADYLLAKSLSVFGEYYSVLNEMELFTRGIYMGLLIEGNRTVCERVDSALVTSFYGVLENLAYSRKDFFFCSCKALLEDGFLDCGAEGVRAKRISSANKYCRSLENFGILDWNDHYW
ncbi:unnamed protein product [Enterobius vermicularis]|uniref:Translin n=1 Tax=Enterobius vermicularis TaxID=51028 RepID=A0A0N4V0F9_ENTVE|nr:unnamed protein product [Enterobius vermicularis]